MKEALYPLATKIYTVMTDKQQINLLDNKISGTSSGENIQGCFCGIFVLWKFSPDLVIQVDIESMDNFEINGVQGSVVEG